MQKISNTKSPKSLNGYDLPRPGDYLNDSALHCKKHEDQNKHSNYHSTEARGNEIIEKLKKEDTIISQLQLLDDIDERNHDTCSLSEIDESIVNIFDMLCSLNTIQASDDEDKKMYQEQKAYTMPDDHTGTPNVTNYEMKNK